MTTEIIDRPVYPSLEWDAVAFLNTAVTGGAIRVYRSGETEEFWARRFASKAKAYNLAWTMRYDGEYMIAWCDVPESQKNVPETLDLALTESLAIWDGTSEQQKDLADPLVMGVTDALTDLASTAPGDLIPVALTEGVTVEVV